MYYELNLSSSPTRSERSEDEKMFLHPTDTTVLGSNDSVMDESSPVMTPQRRVENTRAEEGLGRDQRRLNTTSPSLGEPQQPVSSIEAVSTTYHVNCVDVDSF